jgi:hypothetical protein
VPRIKAPTLTLPKRGREQAAPTLTLPQRGREQLAPTPIGPLPDPPPQAGEGGVSPEGGGEAAPTLPSPSGGGSLEALTSFPGMGLEQQVADMGRDQVTGPANFQIGVGPTQVAEVVNSDISIWTKTGGRVSTEDLAVLFSVPSDSVFSDPNIVYDNAAGRWFLSSSSFNAAYNSNVYVAASQNSDATGTWYIYTLASTTGVLIDQPLLGNGTDVMVMAWGDFATPCSPGCTFQGDEMFAVQKSELMAGTTPLDRASPGPDLTRFGLLPVRTLSASTAEYFVWNNSDPTTLFTQTTPGPTVGLIQVTGQPANHDVQFNELFTPTITATTAPPSAPQPAGGPALETGDDRLESAVWQNGTLWTAASEGCPSGGVGGCIRLLKLDTSAGTVTESELGAASDFIFNPAVTMDNSGRLIVAYTESSGTVYPRAVAATVGAGAQALAFGNGSAALDVGLCGLSPWHGLAGAAVDPSNAADVWVAGAFGANSTDLCDWRSAVARLTLAAPTVATFVPTTVPQSGGTVVTVAGTDFVEGGTSVQFPSGAGTSVNVISPEELTAVVPASGSATSGAVTVTTANGTTASAGAMKTVPYSFSPAPIAPNGSLAANATVTTTLTVQGGTASYLSFAGSGSACVTVVTCMALTATPTAYTPVAGQISIRYTAPNSPPTSGTATITVQDAPTSPANVLTDSYTFTPSVTRVSFYGSPAIAPEGDLVAGMSVSVVLTATAGTTPVPNTTVNLAYAPGAGGGAASVRNLALTGSAQPFTTDANGQLTILYTLPDPLPPGGATDTITATAPGGAVDHDSYTIPPVTTFYFAEGFTANGFSEILSLLMPNENGTVLIDYYTQTGHGQSVAFLTQGEVEMVDVGSTVGANQQVSMKVTMPGPGVAERTLHFTFGSWFGSTSIVGATGPSTQWNFAEGSTLGYFSEYLTLQNPNSSVAAVQLNYFTDLPGVSPVRTLKLPANTRTTVAVFDGTTGLSTGDCVVSGGNASHCGVGPGIGGVAVNVTSSLPIIAERPFYVNGFSFGSGPIRDGHVAFGATAPQTQWNFAEGTTLAGFNEYLTLQNPNASPVTAQLHYFTDASGHPAPTKTLTLPASSRTTVEVWRGDLSTNPGCSAANGTCGVGPGIAGVSVQVTASQPIVAERPMYMDFNFGSGLVAGAHDVVGSPQLGQLFGFAWASTLASDNDFLTIQNPGATTANITATYYTSTGVVVRNFPVAASSRHTLALYQAVEGPGPGFYPLGIVLQSDQPVLVEKPTYSRTTATYGATDTLGYTPTGF